MFELTKFFNKNRARENRETPPHRRQDVLLAVCALFLEMAHIDEKFTAQERRNILGILKKKYGLAAEHADALMAEAERERQQSVDLWQFAKLINENYSIDEKMQVIDILWRMVYVDGKMDAYEHYLMAKLKNLLRLSQDQLIAAKLKVLHGD